jgi:ankyrin repeat protein
MKKLFFITGFMVVGLQVGIGFARGNDWANKGQNIANAVNSYKPDSNWKPTGPTAEDILAATKVKNLAAKGSLEDKLISAVQNGDLKNIKTLIAAGAGLEARDNGDRTALMRAAEKGSADVTRILIDAGADVNARDKFDWTPLFMAADKGHTDIVRILMAAGASDGKNFESIFVPAVFNGDIDMVKAIVESANINCDILETAYMLALNKRNTELVNIIKHLKSQCNSSKIVD